MSPSGWRPFYALSHTPPTRATTREDAPRWRCESAFDRGGIGACIGRHSLRLMNMRLRGDGKFRDEVVRIAELTVNTSLLEDLEFSNCRIIGPAVLVVLENVSMIGCRWDAPGLDAVFWEVPTTRRTVVGAVGVRNVTFSACSFEGVGIAGPPELREAFARGF